MVCLMKRYVKYIIAIREANAVIVRRTHGLDSVRKPQ